MQALQINRASIARAEADPTVQAALMRKGTNRALTPNEDRILRNFIAKYRSQLEQNGLKGSVQDIMAGMRAAIMRMPDDVRATLMQELAPAQ